MKEYDEGDPAIQADPKLASLIADRRPDIAAILGRSADSVRIRWSAETDESGCRVVEIRLSDRDLPEGVSTRLTPWELADTRSFRRRVRDLFGDLLFAGLRQINARLQSLPIDGVTS